MQINLPSYPAPATFIDSQKNSFSQYPSKTQLFTYFLIIIEVIIYYSCINTLVFNIYLLALFTLFLIVLFISWFLCSYADTTDKLTFAYKWHNYLLNHTNQGSFLEYIEPGVRSQDIVKMNFISYGYCVICDSYIMQKTKHCKSCQKCSAYFDHHCIWINNCVACKNYVSFFVMIVSLFMSMVVFIIHGILGSIYSYFSTISVIVREVFMWLGMMYILVLCILLANLIILHCYLIATRQTTIQLLTKIKRQQQRETEAKRTTREQGSDKKTGQQQTGCQIINTQVNNTENIKNHQCTSHSLKIKPKQLKVNSKKSQNINLDICDQEQISSNKCSIHQQSLNEQEVPMFFKNNKSLKLLLSNHTLDL